MQLINLDSVLRPLIGITQVSKFDDEFRIADASIKDRYAETKKREDAEAAKKAAAKAADDSRRESIREKYEDEMRRIFAIIEPKFRQRGYHVRLERGDIEIFRSLELKRGTIKERGPHPDIVRTRKVWGPVWTPELTTSAIYDESGDVRIEIKQSGVASKEVVSINESKLVEAVQIGGTSVDFDYVEVLLANYIAHSQVHGVGEINAQRYVTPTSDKLELKYVVRRIVAVVALALLGYYIAKTYLL